MYLEKKSKYKSTNLLLMICTQKILEHRRRCPADPSLSPVASTVDFFKARTRNTEKQVVGFCYRICSTNFVQIILSCLYFVSLLMCTSHRGKFFYCMGVGFDCTQVRIERAQISFGHTGVSRPRHHSIGLTFGYR